MTEEICGMKVVIRPDWAPVRFELVAKTFSPTDAAAAYIGATPADIPGLWNAPGYPELTAGQLLQVASDRVQAMLKAASV